MKVDLDYQVGDIVTRKVEDGLFLNSLWSKNGIPILLKVLSIDTIRLAVTLEKVSDGSRWGEWDLERFQKDSGILDLKEFL